jgi:hypothetical protein
VAIIERTWHLQTGRWRGEGERIDPRYREVATREGMRCVASHNRVAAIWRLGSVYDCGGDVAGRCSGT